MNIFGRAVVALIAGGGCATSPAVSGSAMPLNLTPAPPLFAASASYDFDLLGTLHGEKCVARAEMENQVYWTAGLNVEKFSDDRLTRSAIAAAAFEVANNLPGIDAFVVTRVIATARGPGMVCAKVYGRGARLKKYTPATGEAGLLPPPAASGQAPPQ